MNLRSTGIVSDFFRATVFALSVLGCAPVIAQPPEKTTALQAMHRAVEFFRTEVGFQGAYLWRYSDDLSRQEGEGKAYKTTGWTQPPGTPAVGEAFLYAWRMTGDEQCLQAALESALALIRSQLKSGGWDSRFELDPKYRADYAYRTDGDQSGQRNYSTFDDNKSQSVLMLLMHCDEATKFQDERLHEAVNYALAKILSVQYPNGAWPQQFNGPPEVSKHPVKTAAFPESWSRTFPKQDYREFYTLNDNNMSHIIDLLFEAERIYDRPDCRIAAEKTGDFFVLAQLPQPQPGWAQQYDQNMFPAWARKFEPASITGGESQNVMQTLLTLYEKTGQRRFIEPIPPAIAYYRKSLLPDGRLARFYELKTNQPLYFTKDYQLTYSDSDLPTHYAFKVNSKLDQIEAKYRTLVSNRPTKHPPALERPKLNSKLAESAAAVIAAMDDRGAWVEAGTLRYHGNQDPAVRIIQTETFIKNLKILAQYYAATND